MVSNTLGIELGELLKAVRRMKRAHARDAEYQKLRANFPKDWPI
jgi:hypothetical protein